MNKIYILSGLGVDSRVFEKINLSNFSIEHIEWIKEIKNENIKDYAIKISEKINEENPILIGLSFGGIIAIEISKIIKVEKVIIIASAKTKYEIPITYRIFGKLKLNYLIPSFLLNRQNFIINWFFGLESTSEKRLLKIILKETNLSFSKWAINEIINWQNTEVSTNIIHIHGNKDRILPLNNQKIDFLIDKGGHFMTMNKSKEIENILQKVLIDLQSKKE